MKRKQPHKYALDNSAQLKRFHDLNKLQNLQIYA